MLKPGDVVDGRYEISSFVAGGGFGNVYRAIDSLLSRDVAVKLLHSETANSEAVLRFRREASAVGQLQHPNIVRCYAIGLHNGSMYSALEYLEGDTLFDLIRRNELDWRRSLRIVIQICRGMQHAHDARIIHRDLTPGNIVVSAGNDGDVARVLDFGLAAFTDDQNRGKITTTGAAVGSVYYMSPEQCCARQVDHRSDIYALGCVLHHCLTGEPPFSSQNAVHLMQKHVSEKQRRCSELNAQSDFPKVLDDVVAKATAKSVERRYQTMSEFAADLERVLDGSEPAAGGFASRFDGGKSGVLPNSPVVVSAVAAIISVFACFVFFLGPCTMLLLSWMSPVEQAHVATEWANWLDAKDLRYQADSLLNSYAAIGNRVSDNKLARACILNSMSAMALKRKQDSAAAHISEQAIACLHDYVTSTRKSAQTASDQRAFGEIAAQSASLLLRTDVYSQKAFDELVYMAAVQPESTATLLKAAIQMYRENAMGAANPERMATALEECFRSSKTAGNAELQLLCAQQILALTVSADSRTWRNRVISRLDVLAHDLRATDPRLAIQFCKEMAAAPCRTPQAFICRMNAAARLAYWCKLDGHPEQVDHWARVATKDIESRLWDPQDPQSSLFIERARKLIQLAKSG
jgi:hypothetical protein